MASRWDYYKVMCENKAEAIVEKDKFQRKGMIAKICRRNAIYANGKQYGGNYVVKARIPKHGVNEYVIVKQSLKTPYVVVNVPSLENNVEIITPTALRMTKEEVVEFINETKSLNNKTDNDSL